MMGEAMKAIVNMILYFTRPMPQTDHEGIGSTLLPEVAMKLQNESASALPPKGSVDTSTTPLDMQLRLGGLL